MTFNPIEQANALTTLAGDGSREDLEEQIDYIPAHHLRPTLVELALMRAMDLRRIRDTFALDTRDVLGEFDSED